MYETDTTREGKRTSSGILHFNYSKWHFLGKTIRDGCLFPGFQLFFRLPFFFPLGPPRCPASFLFLVFFKKLIVFPLTSPATRLWWSLKHLCSSQFSVVRSVWGRDWLAEVSLKQQVTQAGKDSVSVVSQRFSLYIDTPTMTLNDQTLTVSYLIQLSFYRISDTQLISGMMMCQIMVWRIKKKKQ